MNKIVFLNLGQIRGELTNPCLFNEIRNDGRTIMIGSYSCSICKYFDDKYSPDGIYCKRDIKVVII